MYFSMIKAKILNLLVVLSGQGLPWSVEGVSGCEEHRASWVLVILLCPPGGGFMSEFIL